jgi:hypothetical protein
MKPSLCPDILQTIASTLNQEKLSKKTKQNVLQHIKSDCILQALELDPKISVKLTSLPTMISLNIGPRSLNFDTTGACMGAKTDLETALWKKK